jgi:hypothetical protein
VVEYQDGQEMHHVGYKNYGIFLGLIAGAFAGVDSVILAGGSAGGYGSIWNFDRTRAAFGSSTVVMYSDSGIPLGPDVLTDDLHQLWLAGWGQDQNVPPECGEACADARFDSVFGYNVEAHPDSRFALDSSVADEVIRSVLSFGFPGIVPPTISEDLFADGLYDFAQGIQERPNAHVFYVDGAMERTGWLEWVDYRTWHVFWKTQPGNPHIKVSGSPDADLAGWLSDFTQGSDLWDNFIPDWMGEGSL